MDDMRFTDYDVLAATPVIALADAKAFLQITDSASDALLTRLVALTGEQLERYCDRPLFPKRAITETVVNEVAATSVALSYRPLAVLTSISADGVSVPLTDLYAPLNAGIVRRIDGSKLGAKIVAIYDTGYQTAPQTLIEAALELVRDWYNAAQRRADIKSESVPDVGSVTYTEGIPQMTGPSGFSLPASAANLLAPFCRTFAP